MIRIEQVYKSFSLGKEEKQVLDNISFQLEKGELVTLLGESGCGKSTLLQIIGGFMKPNHGEVFLNGQIVTRPVRTCVTVFQDENLLPWLTVIDNVMLGLTSSKAEKRKKAAEFLRFVGLGEHFNSFPHELSGGMKQRVAIARAFAVEPSVILMDEPFAALDTFNRYYLQDELLRLQAQKEVSILLVTHDIEEAIYLSDRVIMLSSNPGRIYETIQIPFAKPRDRSSEEFNRFRKTILQTFRFSNEAKKLEFYI